MKLKTIKVKKVRVNKLKLMIGVYGIILGIIFLIIFILGGSILLSHRFLTFIFLIGVFSIIFWICWIINTLISKEDIWEEQEIKI